MDEAKNNNKKESDEGREINLKQRLERGGGANLEGRRNGEKREQGFGAAVPGWES
jgi:hypothetical protein